MTTAIEMAREGRRSEIWERYCGFLDLTLPEFMSIQKRLLMEQILLLSQCDLGRNLLRGRAPRSVEEFREAVPLSTYADYAPYLLEKNESSLPRPPRVWARTSGRSGEFGFKWVPFSEEMFQKVGEFGVASFLLASCARKGDVRLKDGDTCLYTLAPPAYFTGAVVAPALAEQLGFKFMPSLEEGNGMEFQERIAEGFKIGMKEGIDFFYGLSSVLVKIAQQFQGSGGDFHFSTELLHPRILGRFLRGLVGSRMTTRSLLPRDLWRVKGIVAGGMDTAFYADRIEDYWGRRPLEGYGGTEIAGVALQAWNHQGMTFLPDCNFLEFVPEEDYYRSRVDSTFEPRTLLLDELDLGVYELVVTNLHGGVFTRYRTGDLIRIAALRDGELGIETPQMVFHARADGVIDVAGFTRITEKAMWQALENSAVDYVDWTVRKEYVADKPILHLYLEVVPNGCDEREVQGRIHESLKRIDEGYGDLEKMLGLNPLRVTFLPLGAFGRYTSQRIADGADLAHIKPPHVNVKEETLRELMAV